MKEPDQILRAGTKVITTELETDPTFVKAIYVRDEYKAARRPGALATLGMYVSGHGGDIYWAKHDDGSIAVYGWSEFDLASPPQGKGEP